MTTKALARGAGVMLGLLVGASPFLARRARADPADEATAAQFFRAGMASYDRHEYRAAALAFEEAYTRTPRGPAIYNAGRAWQAAGDAARAADAFALSLAGGDLAQGDASRAAAGLQALEPQLGVLDVSGPSAVTAILDDVDRGRLPRRLHVAPGTHELRARRSDGTVVSRRLDVRAGESIPVTFEDARPAPVTAVVVQPAVPEARTGSSVLRTAGFVALGGGVLLGIAGGVTFGEFVSSRSQFDAGGDHDASLHATADAFRTATYILWGAGLASALAGGALLVAPMVGRSQTVGVALDPGVVSVRGRF